MSNQQTAGEIENLKNNLIDFASQGGDQRTQATAESMINTLLQEHTNQRLSELRGRVKEEVEKHGHCDAGTTLKFIDELTKHNQYD